MDYTEFWNAVEKERDALVAFAQVLIQTQSLSGQEADIAAVIQSEMNRLGYDRVWVDEAGNVIGQVFGQDRPPLMLNGHMDHVDAGDPDLWAHLPFGGEIHDGELWGRGSVDMKGALAAMIYAGGLLKKLDAPLPGDLYVSAAVQEEVGGLGSRHMAKTLPIGRAIIGEASGNHLRRGHRGRVELDVTWEGRSVHAGMPHLGVNPHFSMSRFVAGLRGLDMVSDPVYGASTVTPTRVTSDPFSANVTPSALHLVLDWRNIPSEGVEEIVAMLQALLVQSLEPGCEGKATIATKELVSYTGLRLSYSDEFPSFTTADDDPYLARARETLEAALDRQVGVDTWRFATDGGHFAAAGAKVIGFGPGDDAIVHTSEERLPLDQLLESTVGYMVLSTI
jgi:putative selenium metabolism hydrolase